MATTQPSRSRLRCRGGAVTRTSITPPNRSTSSSSIRASAMSCSRFRGSFWRQRSSSLRTDVGVLGGRALQSGSRWRTAGKRVGPRGSVKRPLSGQHLEQHTAERPDVRALVDRLPASLFGAHVGGRPENAPVSGSAERLRRIWWPVGIQTDSHRLGQSEIEHLRARVARRNTRCGPMRLCRTMFAGFKSRWTMPFVVRGLQRLGDLTRDRDGVRHSAEARARDARRAWAPRRARARAPSRRPSPPARRWRRCVDG